MINNYFSLNLIILIGIIRFIILSNHYLVLLLRIEFIILRILIIFRSQNQIISKETRIIFLFLCIIIMEGIFGLSLLLISSQSYGKDYIIILI